MNCSVVEPRERPRGSPRLRRLRSALTRLGAGAAKALGSPPARFLGMALVLLTGLGISALLFKEARVAEQRDVTAALADVADQEVELLEIQVTRSMESLHAIGSYLRARPGASGDDFARFVSDALARQAELQALGWSPRVSGGERGRVEHALGKTFVEGDPAHGHADVHPARPRAEYFPVAFIEPRGGNERAVGFDVASDPVRREAMDAARDAGTAVATAPLSLVQGGGGGDARGFIVYLPVYGTRPAAPTVAERRAALTGYASAVFRVDTLLSGVGRRLAAAGVSLDVVDDAARAALATAPPADGAAVARTLRVAGRAWRVTIGARPAFVAARAHGRPWGVLATGTCVTLLIGAYLSAVISRTTAVERRVLRRTEQLSREVAERARAQEAARQAELAYRSIFDNSVEGIFQTTPDGHYLRANAALAGIYGYASPEELIADLSDIAYQLYVEPGRRAEFAREVRRTGVVINFESQVYRKDGRAIWISENARAVYDAAGNVLHYEGFVVDVTARRAADDMRLRIMGELEQRVRERTEALAAADAAKSRFLAAMSHEIRTPMNAILGYAQVMRRDATLPEARRDAVAAIVSSGNHLLGLIDGILDLSRIEAGHVELHDAPFHLDALADDLQRMFGQRCRQKGVAFVVACPRASVRGDEQKLRQVLVNLAANAVRFTDAGEVTLRVRRRGPGEFLFEVRDTGVGIAADSLARIFEPFQQGDAPGGARGGTGLGLTIARQFVRLMGGGDLAVRSDVGVGSCFSFTLPLREAGPTDGTPAEPDWALARLAPGRAVSALVVDDVPENRRVLRAMLEAAGIDVTAAASGAEAVALAADRSHRFDVALVDIFMPGMDGFETAARLAALPGAARTPVVATSAAVFAHDRARYEAARFADVLAKPIAAPRLYRCVADLTGARFDVDAPVDAPAAPAWSPAAAAAEASRLPPDLAERLALAADQCSVTDLRACAAELDALGLGAGHLARCVDESLRTFDPAALAAALAELGSVAPPAGGAR